MRKVRALALRCCSGGLANVPAMMCLQRKTSVGWARRVSGDRHRSQHSMGASMRACAAISSPGLPFTIDPSSFVLRTHSPNGQDVREDGLTVKTCRERSLERRRLVHSLRVFLKLSVGCEKPFERSRHAVPLAEETHCGKSRKEQENPRNGASEPLSCVSSTIAAGNRVYVAFNTFDVEHGRQQRPFVHLRC